MRDDSFGSDGARTALAAFQVLMAGQRDETVDHCLRLRSSAIALGETLALEAAALRDLEFAALLHDVGMFKLPRAVREKPATLTPEEWRLVRRHPDLGAAMVAEITTLERAAEIVRAHHERWDGAGYPAGLAGEAIPLEARIIAVVDAYDAMRHGHRGTTVRSSADAIAALRRDAGSHFDPRVVEAFAEIEPILERYATRT